MATKRPALDLKAAVGLTDRDARARARRVGVLAFKAWRGMTSTLKPRYRVPYNAAMSVRVRDANTVILTLDPPRETATLVRSVEYGFGPGGVGTTGPYDMRKTLTRPGTKSLRTGRDGTRYLSVPMRKTTRRIIQRGGYAAYAAVQRLEASVRGVGFTAWGGRLANPSGYAAKIHPHARNVKGIGHVPPHATDPLANMYRFKKPGAKGGSTYGIFRTISSKGKPWVHPGIRSHRFIRKVARLIPQIVKDVG
jgi:hypothetical protein